jgi:hypothetical protein
MVLTVLCMAVMLGFVAFAVDVGNLLRARRVLQTAADSAAIAGAAEYNIGDWSSAAKVDASQNGVTDGTSGAVVTVNPAPTSGPHEGVPGYVEVIVSQPQRTFFLSVLNPTPVAARAVATLLPNPNCIYTLSSAPANGEGLILQNGASVNAPTCGVLDNATGNVAMEVQSSTITAKSIAIVGTQDVSAGGSISPTPVTGISQVADPLGFLTPPTFDPGSCNNDPAYTGAQPYELMPGCYKGLTLNGTGAVTIDPGLYIINGALNLNGSGSITGTDVTFYITYSNGTPYPTSILYRTPAISLTAPTSGTYSGILFYQDPNDLGSMVFLTGNATTTINGIFYLPGTSLTLDGNAASPFNSSFVVGSLSFTGNNSYFNITPYVSSLGTSPLSTPRLVE